MKCVIIVEQMANVHTMPKLNLVECCHVKYVPRVGNFCKIINQHIVWQVHWNC